MSATVGEWRDWAGHRNAAVIFRTAFYHNVFTHNFGASTGEHALDGSLEIQPSLHRGPVVFQCAQVRRAGNLDALLSLQSTRAYSRR